MENDNVIIAKASIELIDNNNDLREVWEAMKKKWDENTKAEITNYKKGDHVVVTFKSGKLYPAIVEKVNTKTIGVVLTGEYEGSKYRVSPSYINHN